MTLDLPLAISKIRGKQFKIPGKGIRNNRGPNQKLLQKVIRQESMRIPFNLEFRHFQKLKIQKISYLKCQKCQNYAANIQILTIYTAHQNIKMNIQLVSAQEAIWPPNKVAAMDNTTSKLTSIPWVRSFSICGGTREKNPFN